MPVMDGYETMRAIRAHRAVQDAPDHRGDRQGRAPASASAASMPAPTTTCRSRSTPPSCFAALGPWLPADRARRDDDRSRASTMAARADASGRRLASPVPVLVVDDNAGEAPRAEVGAGAARLRDRRSRLRARRAALRHGAGLRGHPARRAHADHGRLRDRRAHPPAPAVGDDADHLHHRVRQRRDRARPIATPKARSTSSSPRSRPTSCAPRSSVFANLFIKAEQLAAQAREVQASADQLRLLTDAAPDRHLPDRRREPLRVHEPALERDHRHRAPTRRPAEPWDVIIDAAERAPELARLASRRRPSVELDHRFEIRLPGVAAAHRAS